MSYYMADRKHRKAFLEARQSLEVKLNLEEQSQQQVTSNLYLDYQQCLPFFWPSMYVCVCVSNGSTAKITAEKN